MTNLDSAGLINRNFWRSLFAADSIAVIGAKNEVGSWGFDALRASLASTRAGVKRRVYAVNPNISEILGVTPYPSILDIPNPVELAVIVVPAGIVPAVLRQCVQKGVKAAVIISAGFSEVDEAGARLQAELVAIARQGGMHFVGPNCIGHADLHSQVASAGIAGRIGPGPMALISQSGTLGASIIQLAATRGLGLSKFISTGNEADLRLEDYLEYLAHDEDTRVITAYIEGLREGRRFFQLAQEITVRKPIIAIKTGTTGESSRAARSHTGALAGSDAVYTAAFKQAGVIRADDEEELCDVASALISQPLPLGKGIGILTMGGGFGVVTAEACEKEGLRIASLEAQTVEKMNAILPPRWSHGNPVDLVGIRSAAEATTVSSCLSLLMADKNVDAVISLLPPSVPPPGLTGTFSPEHLRAIQMENQKHLAFLNQQVKQYGKPLVLIRRFFSQPAGETNASSSTPQERIPEYSHPRRAARALRHLAWYRQYLDYRKAESAC
jgi:acyl-CoA synthetase (NDP forming)